MRSSLWFVTNGTWFVLMGVIGKERPEPVKFTARSGEPGMPTACASGKVWSLVGSPPAAVDSLSRRARKLSMIDAPPVAPTTIRNRRCEAGVSACALLQDGAEEEIGLEQ